MTYSNGNNGNGNGRFSVYQMITDRIIASLEKGEIPWRKPWKLAHTPMNFKTKRPYRGINILMLAAMGYSSPYWMTFNQVKAMGGHVNKGEKATPVIFWKVGTREVEDPETGETAERNTFLLRYYNVFNVEQTSLAEIIAEEAKEAEPVDVPTCEEIVKGYKNGPSLKHGGDRAFYRPSEDHVQMPHKKQFDTMEHYYATLFHELTHSTGHTKRLSRESFQKDTVASFGSELYGKEELVAEMGSAFLCGMTGISKPDLDVNTTAYLQSWIKTIKGEPKMVVLAAAQAQKAVDLITNQVPAQVAAA